MSSYRNLAVASALAFAVACGGGDNNRASNANEGGGGANGVGDDARPTAAERTGATGDSGRAGGGLMSLSDSDRQFVQKASMSNQMEVALGNLAEEKAQRDDVKQFGEELARDHEAANRELQTSIGGGDATTAQQPGGGISSIGRPNSATDQSAREQQNARPGQQGAQREQPASGAQNAQSGEMGQMHQQMQQTQQKLEGLSGQAFDRAYLEEMVKHHQQDIQEFERAAQSDNAQIRQFAERTLPTLREHLQQAQQLQKSAGQEGGRGRQ